MADKPWGLQWLAGLLEGEGYFGKYCHAMTQRVDFWTTDPDVAATAARLCRVKAKPRNRSAYRDGKKPQFGFTLCGENARRTMMTVLPYMHSRRAMAIRKALAHER